MGRVTIVCAVAALVAGGACWGQSGITLDGDIEDIWNKSGAWTGTDVLDSSLCGYDIRRVAVWRCFYEDGGDTKCDVYVGVEVSGTPGDTDGDDDPDTDADPDTEPTDFLSIGTEFSETGRPQADRSEYVIVQFDEGPPTWAWWGCGVDYTTNWPDSNCTGDYSTKGYACGALDGSGLSITDDEAADDADFAMASSSGAWQGYEMVFRNFHNYVSSDFDVIVKTNAASGGEDTFSVNPTAVMLASAAGHPAEEARRLTWKTGAEAGLVGFNVWAASNKLGPYEKLNRRLLPTMAEGGVSGTYKYLDQTPAFARHQYYRIELVREDGSSECSDPVEVTSAEDRRALLRPPRG